jgi:hypothetical protein
MRIIIETDSREAAATSVQPQMILTTIPQVSAMPSGLARPSMTSEPFSVAGVGATDAGPAPSAIEASALTAVPAALTGSTDMTVTPGFLSTAVALGAIDAGPAPTSVTVSEEAMALGGQSGVEAPTSTFYAGTAGMSRVTVADTL